MEALQFSFKSVTAKLDNYGCTTGVVNSGNLEVLLEKNANPEEAVFSISTTVRGFKDTWAAVINDFSAQYAVGGCHFILNDCGATPAVVSLRLRQLYEKFIVAALNNLSSSRYLELDSRERVLALCDPDSFTEWLPPWQRITSPNLEPLDLPTSFDDGVVIGQASLEGKPIFIASQNFAFMGGAVGEINGAKLTGLCLRALRDKPDAVVLLLDSGGVRLQEANAGEIAISELIAAIMELRFSHIPVFGIVAGKNGAFGGIGIASACLDKIILTENARTGVSGPEVIETVMGVAEYDSSDRALVWRTCGGRHRHLLGDGNYALKDISSIKNELLLLIKQYQPLSLGMLKAENEMLKQRIELSQDCHDGHDVWKKFGYTDVSNIPDLADIDFIKLSSNRLEFQ